MHWPYRMSDLVRQEDSLYCDARGDMQPLSQDISTITGSETSATSGTDISSITLRLEQQAVTSGALDDLSDIDEDLHDSSHVCSKCRQRRLCSKVLYVWISLLVLGCLIALIVVGVLVVGPYKQAENFRSSMCTAVSAAYRTEHKCTCGKGCSSGYPCLELVVDMADSSPTPRRVVLHENEAALDRQCTFYPACKSSGPANEKAVYAYTEQYGTPGRRFPCLYNPDNPSEVIRTRRFHLHHVIHGMVWSSLIFTLSLIILIFAIRKKGCDFL